MGHPYKFHRVLRLGSVTARHLVVGVSQTAAFNRGRHLYSAGQPSRWVLAHISSFILFLLPRSSFFFFFLALSQQSEIGCLPYFGTWCGPSVNLECKSETCCARLAGNTGRKKVAKNRHLGTIAQLCRAISSQLRHVSTIGKKFVKQQYLLYMS